MSLHSISSEIHRLKQKRNAVILAHYYQPPEIQDLADHVGDSFALSKTASGLPHQVVVLCGVRFMAETVKILSPEKTVLLPASEAGCPMADMATAADVCKLKEQHPEAAVVSYVNTSAEVKALSDICCTSANAVRIIRSLPQKKIIFLPDENLGSFVAEKVPEKEFVLFKGFCPVHEEVMEIDVILAREQNPGAWLVAHPECRPEVRRQAVFVGSTNQIIDFVTQSDHNSFIIGTEMGILHPLHNLNPGKRIVILTPNFICPNMKKIRAENVLQSLKENREEIILDKELIEKSFLPLKRMLEVSS
jgi:quinolinate synthase